MAVSDHDVLAHLAGVQSIGDVTPYAVLTRLSEEPASFDTLADEFDVDRTTIYRLLNPIREWHFISNEGVDHDGYEVTGLGAVVLHHIDVTTTADEFGDPDSSLSYLLGATSRPTILKRLREAPSRKADLSRGPNAPSRSTVHRAINGFTDHELVERDYSAGHYKLTDSGQEVIATYESLINGVHIARRHTIFFCCCDERIADIPVTSLATVERTIDEAISPERTILALRELVENGITEVRGLRSHVSAQLADIFYPVIKSGVPYESIITEPVLYNLPRTGRYRDIVSTALRATNVRILVVPGIEEFPFGLGILNGDTVVLAPASPGHAVNFGSGLQSETLIGHDPELIAWAEKRYAEYQQVARSPLRYVIADLFNRAVPIDTEHKSE
ncbi:hypothetical protein [Haloprofundus salilacus]|uniref:transcriptional regulator FilR1 domain-containing protein n=1 Tax=Haloprofundus salilacus TaxID=2876190 RepID=UPI001CCC84E9|nr:hypothetical protein [Haloprofundus salilacus]